VNWVHSCFKATGGKQRRSLGLRNLGEQEPPPLSNAQASSKLYQASPRVTRSEGRKDNLVSSMKDFARCICADDFRDSVASPEGKNGKPAEFLGKLPFSCFVHRSIFEIFGDEGSMRAGDLAMRALDNFAGSCEEGSEEEEEDGDPKKRPHSCYFCGRSRTLGCQK
jgi:hypothetical protein